MLWTVMAKMHFQDALLPCCLILVLLQPLLSGKCRYGKADFCVFVPNDTILAIVGKDTELPCHLDPNISVKDMELRWYRAHPSPAVYVYEKGKDVYQEQMKEYQGRTTFLRDGIDKGMAAVRIHNVTTSDNGTYHCHFKDGHASSGATLWLKVAGVGENPRISLRDLKDDSIEAECTSAGWFPEPQVQWTDFRGNSIPSETNVSASATSGLFAVTSSVTVRGRAVGVLKCSIANPLHPERKTASIHLPDSSSSRSPFAASSTVLSLIPVALGLIIAGAICVFWKRQEDESRTLREELREQSRQQANSANGSRESSLIYDCRNAVPYAVSPSLDPDTANSKLFLSEDRKSMERLYFEQDLPDTPERFDQDPCVLGREKFTSGKFYWEVEVGKRKAWNLGVCLESLDRKGRIPKSPAHGVWAIEFYKDTYWALTYPRKRLYLSEPPYLVGILLDCDARNLTFYNKTDRSHLYSFSEISFSGPCQPFFCLWTLDVRPLIICSVFRQLGEVPRPLEGSEVPPGLPGTPIREKRATFLRDGVPPQTQPMSFSP